MAKLCIDSTTVILFLFLPMPDELLLFGMAKVGF